MVGMTPHKPAGVLGHIPEPSVKSRKILAPSGPGVLGPISESSVKSHKIRAPAGPGLLGLDLRSRIVEVARSKIGIPWKHQGRTEFGIDCVGLIVACSKDLGITDFDFFRYSPRPQTRQFTEQFLKAGCTPIEPFTLTSFLPGDIVVLSYGKYPMHCGIYAERRGIPRLIHSSAVGRKCREEDLVIPLSNLVFGGFRYPGIA